MNLSNLLFLAEGDGAQNGWIMWVILGVMVVLMIVMTVIPRKKQQKETQNMMDSLKVGDKVMTIGRIVGEIIEINNQLNTVTIKSGVGDTASTLVIDKLAIGMIINQPGPVSKTEEQKKEDEKEPAPVVEKTAKENKVADLLKQQKKENDGDAFDEIADKDAKVEAEEIKAEAVVEEAKVEEKEAENK